MEQFLEDIKDLEVTTVARAQEAIDQKKKQQPSLLDVRLAHIAESSLLN